jgi:hypothetical protein
LINTTLVASANNDVLVGLDIAPTFTTGGFTGLTNAAIRVAGNIIPSVNLTYTLGTGTNVFALLWSNWVRSSGALLLQGQTDINFSNTTNNVATIFRTSGNLLLQNGGTFTDIASARLSVNSTTQGFLPPRMTTTEKNAIASPATGLVVFDTTLNGIGVYDSTAWRQLATTTQLNTYLPLAGGTMTGAIIGTTSTFTNAGSGIGVEITNSSTGDGLKINHSAGRALNIQSTGANFGIIINNSIASTSIPFTIQKQGTNVVTMTDAGALTIAGALGGTSASFSGDVTIGAASQLYLTSGDLRYNSNAGFGIVTQNGGRLVSIQNGALGVNGAATFSNIATINNADQSGARLVISNTGSGGQAVNLVAGNPNVDNTGFSIAYGNTNFLRFDSSGAATFSSSVTAPSLLITNSAGLVIQPTTTTNQGYLTVVNASGSNIFGIDNSTGSVLGNGAYSRFIYNTGAYPLDFYTNAILRARITSGGNVLIGTTTDNGSKLQVEGSVTATTFTATDIESGVSANYYSPYSGGSSSILRFLYGSSGSVIWNNGGVKMTLTSAGNLTITTLGGSGSRAVLADASGNLSAPVSDISVKQNIISIGYGLNEILKMNPVWFDFIDEYKNYGEGRQNGNIAQEMADIIPEAVFTTPSTGKMGINYDQMHAVYIKAIKELKAEIEELKLKIK